MPASVTRVSVNWNQSKPVKARKFKKIFVGHRAEVGGGVRVSQRKLNFCVG